MLALLLCLVAADLAINEVQGELLLTPHPVHTLRFTVKSAAPISTYTFFLSSVTLPQIGAFRCDYPHAIAPINSTALAVTLSFSPLKTTQFACHFNHLSALRNVPATKDFNDDYEFSFSTFLCPTTPDPLRCTLTLKSKKYTLKDSTPTPTSSSHPTYRYGPFANAMSAPRHLSIHFKTDHAPITYGSILRELTLKDDTIHVQIDVDDMLNTGAPPKHEFSRTTFSSRAVAVHAFTLDIEPNATNVELRDSTGLIHSFTTAPSKKTTRLTISPRYPLLGGWKTSFTIHYDIPAALLYRRLKATSQSPHTLLTPSFSFDLLLPFDGLATTLTTRVVLPEGSTVNKVLHPTTTDFLTVSQETRPAFATIYPRSVVTLSASHVHPSAFQHKIEVEFAEDANATRFRSASALLLGVLVLVLFLTYAKIITN